MEAFGTRLQRGDTIITFNYDLILEQELFARGRWFPHDGYGVLIPSDNSRCSGSTSVSVLTILKLHGSLNWDMSSFDDFLHSERLEWWYDDGTPLFPGYLNDETPPWHTPYEGPHDRYGMLPSFVKTFEYPLLLQVWKRAQAALTSAEKVVVIGYSLPSADSAATLLIGTAGLDMKELTIVDPSAEEVAARFREVTGNRNPEVMLSLQEYIGR